MSAESTNLNPELLAALITALEWGSCVMGLIGALVLATNTRISRWGWLAFFLANLCSVGFALGIERYGLMLQQLGFVATSLLGMARTGLLPGLDLSTRSPPAPHTDAPANAQPR
ncbi:hypothetical protein [Limnohabitans sp.]|uniref:hypothetical protein n=1 Tax=Limnohabitans sp. TaxID=1907725 RepID=UPI00261BD8D2|nr:hypothetical protein [Limnohabitans sp.]